MPGITVTIPAASVRARLLVMPSVSSAEAKPPTHGSTILRATVRAVDKGVERCEEAGEDDQPRVKGNAMGHEEHAESRERQRLDPISREHSGGIASGDRLHERVAGDAFWRIDEDESEQPAE